MTAEYGLCKQITRGSDNSDTVGSIDDSQSMVHVNNMTPGSDSPTDAHLARRAGPTVKLRRVGVAVALLVAELARVVAAQSCI